MAKTRFRPIHHRPWDIPWVRDVLTLCVVLLLAALLVEGFSRLNIYGKTLMAQRARHRPLKRIVLIHAPSWLSSPILNALAAEAVQYTIFNKRHPEYAAELRNPLNGNILRILARHFTDNPSEGFNAWIKHVTYIRRVWLPHQQIIEIACQYRRPAGLVSLGGKYYLVSSHGTRLPGSYLPTDLPALSWLMRISGVKAPVPPPGQRFSAPGIKLGLKMIALLSGHDYSSQIQSIDLANMYAEVPPSTPKIILKTRFGTQIYWGLPPGREGFYEVPASRKLQLLEDVFRQYHRIDAGRAYLDVRSDEVLVPRLPSPANASANNRSQIRPGRIESWRRWELFMRMDMSKKTVLITGASSGIGAACALALARRGASLVLGARRMDKLQAVGEQAKTFGARVLTQSCDVTSRADVIKLVQAAKDQFGRLDIAIANAGFGLRAPVHLTAETQMEEIWRVNVMGTWYVMAEAAPIMLERKTGHIIVVSSAIARRAIPQMGAYAMTKAAELSLAEAQRIELADKGVYVSTVHPITTDTEFFQRATEHSGKRVAGLGKTQSAELVAGKIVRLIEHPQPELWPCAPIRYAMAIAAAFPALVDRAIKKKFSAEHVVKKGD